MAFNARTPRPNIYQVNDASQWPEKGDPFVIYLRNYPDPDPEFGVSAEGPYYFDPVTGEYTQLIHGVQAGFRVMLRMVVLNGVNINLQWSDDKDTTTDPGNGRIKSNGNNLSVVTEFAFSNFDLFGRQIAGGPNTIPLVRVGDPFIVQDLERLSWAWYTASGVVIPEVGFTRLPVTYQDGKTANPQTDELMEVHWLPAIEV